ncbi:MAG TPA: DUF5715 family protein [Longimicrobiaceae bacterium]|nr:DUF5715 family protein [Longimicrobiaceae bacterium]
MLRTASLLLTILVTAAPLAAAVEVSVSLRGSKSSMIRQNQVARAENFTFLRTPDQVHGFVEKGYLVPLPGSADYRVNRGVSFPYARPETRSFVEWISGGYRAACGEPLVVTSLTRTQAVQPANAHELSVHPTGMAVDMRISRNAACRNWLENMLLGLERENVLDVTRERNPAHYHVAVFPHAFRGYLARTATAEPKQRPEPTPQRSVRPAPAAHRPEPVPAPVHGGEAMHSGGGVPRVALALVTFGVLLLFWSERVLGGRRSREWE